MKQPTAAELNAKIHDWLCANGFAVGAVNGTCDDWTGLPAGLHVRPAWNPLECGSHVIVVSATTAYRATRQTPYAMTRWEVVDQRPYEQAEAVTILHLPTSGLAICPDESPISPL